MTTLLSLCLLLALLPCHAWAVDDSRSYDFRLTVNGAQETSASTGDTVTVSLSLVQTDAARRARCTLCRRSWSMTTRSLSSWKAP